MQSQDKNLQTMTFITQSASLPTGNRNKQKEIKKSHYNQHKSFRKNEYENFPELYPETHFIGKLIFSTMQNYHTFQSSAMITRPPRHLTACKIYQKTKRVVEFKYSTTFTDHTLSSSVKKPLFKRSLLTKVTKIFFKNVKWRWALLESNHADISNKVTLLTFKKCTKYCIMKHPECTISMHEYFREVNFESESSLNIKESKGISPISICL